MCGIYGYFDRSGREIDRDTLLAMGNAIRHRGPDDSGLFSAPGVALGNQRLSVIDVEGGHQPFMSDDGSIIVVQNGEIFNHVELAKELVGTRYECRTHSDTEVLLRLYERHGIAFLSRLNGMFAFAIYDQRRQELFLARDRIGIKPLFVFEDGARLIFGSEIKAILPALRSRPEIDLEALSHLLTFNYVPAPHTIHAGVRHLMPGHVMTISPEGSQTQRWWNLAEIEPVHGRDEDEWIEEFNAILDDAVRIRMRSDVPFGAFLSGGVDSSTIVGLMARHREEAVKTFCIGFGDARYDEAPFAQTAAERFGTDHVMRRVDPDMLDLWPLATYHCDQPHGDISFLPTYRVSQLAAEHVKVVLTGDGGDELFAGYDKYANFFARPGVMELDDDVFRRKYFESISLFDQSSKRSILSQSALSSIGDLDSFDVARPYFVECAHQDRINQALYLDMQLLLSGNNLVKPDRMGMAVSIEARAPFLDYRMMEFAFRMPGELKLRNGVTKYLYKKAVSPLIGEDLAFRKKQMFTVPVGDWFRGRLSGYARDHVERVGQRSSLFDLPALRSLADSHIAGTQNNTRELRAIIAVDHWLI